MRAHVGARFVLWLVVIGVLLSGRSAAAQVPNAVYEDARDIIEELIQKEVAQSVVPNVVCRTVHSKAFAEELRRPTPDVERMRGELPLLRYYPRTMQRIFKRRFAALRTAAVDESAGAVGHLIYAALMGQGEAQARQLAAGGMGGTPASGKGAAARTPVGPLVEAEAIATKLAGSNDKAVEEQAKASGAEYVWSPLGDTSLERCVDSMRKWYERDLTESSSTPLDEDCSGALGQTPGKAYACNIGLAVRALLLRKDALAQEHLVKAVAALVAEVGGAAPGGVKDRLAMLDDVTLALREFLYDDAKPFGHVADAFGASTEEGRTFLRERLAGLERLRTQWKLGTYNGSQKLDMAYFVKEMSAPAGSLGALCRESVPGVSPASDVCRRITKQRQALAGTLEAFVGPGLAFGGKLNLWSVIQLASRGEYADVASQVMGAFFSSQNGNGNEGTSLYRRFAESVVRYMLDSASEQVPSETTRAAFREAAVEVLQDLAQGGGMERSFWGAFYRPDLALRLSWNPAYVNEGSNSSRVLASATLANFRIRHGRSDKYYLATQLSLLDPLAPLSELAQRPTSEIRYERGSRLAANVLAPRVDLLAGVPALSKHLVVTAGASLRLSAPFRVENQAECEPSLDERVCYQYKFVWNKASNVRDMSGFSFLEFGLAIKYML